MKNRALLSVTDKSGIVPFATRLVDLGFELVSTGGTAKALRDAGFAVMDVAEVTGFPEMLDGRVKTLHPNVHGGILADVRQESHRSQLLEAEIAPFQVVCVNLYAFEKTVTSPHTDDEAVESIDIGGPAMIRAAAKNSANVLVVVDPSDYDRVLNYLSGEKEDGINRKLMAKAFRHTAYYDSMISRYFSGEEVFNEQLSFGYQLAYTLRYGENPHQNAGLYLDPLQTFGIAKGKLLSGKELSYNNLLDGDAAWELVSDLPAGSCAIIKHGNPCGVAALVNIADSYRTARLSDPISAFGGISACNGVITASDAEAMTEKGNFLEVVLGTSFTDEAVEIFKNKPGWGPNVRLVELSISPMDEGQTIRSIRGGVLIQDADEERGARWEVVTKRAPSPEEEAALRFQWIVCKHVKSNAIVIGSGDRALGVGAGQMNRVQSVRLALEQAGEAAKGSALASDAFFPFPDSIETAAAAGVTAFVQPGGSKKDSDVIAAADALGLTMVFTGNRHFRH